MRKLIFNTLLFFPLLGFTQGKVDCSLLSVTDVIIQNDSIIFEIYNADTMDTHYPYVSYTLDANGDTIQKGQMSWFVTQAGTSSYYYSTNFGISYVMDSLTEFNVNYPLYIYFTYSNLTGQNPGGYICELFYNTQTDILNTSSNLKKTLIKKIDILGRESKLLQKNQPLFYIYDDGTVEKRIIIE